MEMADFKTGQCYVDALEEVGILRTVTGNKRNRLYRADLLYREDGQRPQEVLPSLHQSTTLDHDRKERR